MSRSGSNDDREDYWEDDPMIDYRQFEPPPLPLTDMHWTTESIQERDGWRITLDDALIDEFDRFQRQHVVDGAFLDAYRHGDHALPKLDELAARVRREAATGTGVVVLTGLPVDRYDEAVLRLFHLALGTAMGHALENYGRLYDIRDYGSSYKESAIPVSQTNAETTYHTDSSSATVVPDFVGLLCVRPARSGGLSQVSNAVAVHEVLREKHPALLRILYRDFVRDIVTPGADRTELRENRFPIFSYGHYGPGLTMRYMRYWIEKGQERAGQPLDRDVIEALDELDRLLTSPDYSFGFMLKRGDMLWVNNRQLVHNRTCYDDDPDHPRTLVRMWVQIDEQYRQ
jgi:alpha-ketoglutarate-dependent taurine dioxygenase